MKAILFILLFQAYLFGQIAGEKVFSHLNSPFNARMAALGGKNLSTRDFDPNMAVFNPALINPQMDNLLSFSFVDYLSDSKAGNISFAHTHKNIGTLVYSMDFIDYGKFERRDVAGNLMGEYSAGDFVWSAAYARPLIDSIFFVGAKFKTAYSQYDGNNSFAVGLDLGLNYHNANKGLDLGLSLNNMGYQLKKFEERNRYDLPFQIDFGLTQHLKHAPFAFSLIYENVQKWNLTRIDPFTPIQRDPLTGEIVPQEEINFGGKLMRHLIISTQIEFTQFFHINLGFNFRRHLDLAYANGKGVSGLTFGVGMRFSQFIFNYSFASYAKGANNNYLSLIIDLNRFIKAKKAITQYLVKRKK